MNIEITKILGVTRNKNHRKYIYAQTKYGIIKYDDVNYRRGHKLTLNLAINKVLFLENYLRDIHKKNIRVISTDFKNNMDRIIVSIDNIKYNPFMKNLLKCLPTSQSCLEKTNLFIRRSKRIHKDNYIYDKSKFINHHKKLKIICKIHGEFNQTPHSHLKGIGCKLCGTSKAASKRLTYTKGIENAIVYCIKMTEDDGTEFYKVGFTRHSLDFRFKKEYINRVKMPYKYEIIFERTFKYKEAIKKESEYHKKLSKYHYIPNKKFDGSATECFTNINLIN